MSVADPIALLRAPETIRRRCEDVLQAGLRGQLAHFELDLSQLKEAAALTAEITRRRYPALRVPPHSRFAHFDAGGVPRCAALESELSGLPPPERARRLLELAVVSVLLDAGAGSAWSFFDRASGLRLPRSEGLAVASLAWAKQGGFSATREPYRVDAAGLSTIDEEALSQALQVGPDNPLLGVAGRVHLLRALGQALRDKPELFGPDARIGGLLDALQREANGGAISAERLLQVVLEGLGGIWPGRLELQGVALGDVWRHAAAGGEGPTRGLVPFHKLSQWLCYSLLYPLSVAGLRVRELSALTGLAEYRNGGLLIDTGVLALRDPAARERRHAVDSELVVEWRALTVALLERIAPLVRAALGLDAAQLPLCAVLEGGTWAAGRELARRRRPDGSPPLQITSDGTVF